MYYSTWLSLKPVFQIYALKKHSYVIARGRFDNSWKIPEASVSAMKLTGAVDLMK